MANLSKISNLTRKIFEIVVAGVVGFIVLVILVNVGTAIKNIIAPTPPAPPSVAFGKLTNVTFPQNLQNSTYTYAINTLSGNLPTLPDRINVYKLVQPSPDLLGLDKAKTIAQQANFLGNPAMLSDTSYQWNNTDPFSMTFTMNTQSFDFQLNSAFKDDATVQQAAHLPDEATAQQTAQSFFDSVMALPSSIDQSKTKTTLLSIQAKGLVPAASLSQAQIIRVDFFPKAVDTYPIYTADPSKSLIYANVASGQTDYPQIVEAQYIHKDVSSQKATYPILTASSAYKKLQQGDGFIATNPTGNTNISITNVFLGYYVQPQNQAYLWPIIIFQGDNGFFAYVSAVTDEWVQM